MEKSISSFNLNSSVKNGKCIFNITCSNCNSTFEFLTQHKLNRSKIKLCKCPNCNSYLQIGEIYNFRDFSLLGNRLDDRYDQEKWINNDWNIKET